MPGMGVQFDKLRKDLETARAALQRALRHG
jgi:hypothetical protein